ncbi:hypothetical protein PPSIR1_05538 [Plesiocystis pacifica SIR-1]|uniref:Helix-hairpin-helix domain-containing protein n=2 Tax=Plesiocystis pacifica TaxID=191768 RepID=A6FX80_9BACT|nr:hypothetical protein PPSIR1_05538 [Plesiocystis pacifica SIR-1]
MVRLRPRPLRLGPARSDEEAREIMSATRRLLTAALGLATLVAAPRAASAAEYEIFIDIDDEESLYDLYVTNQISEDTFNTLVELRRRGVDLNEATREELYTLPNLSFEDVDRILAYRAEVGVIHAPADLLAAEVLDQRKLGSILTFIRANDQRRKLTATHGWVRYQTAYTPTDTTVPPMALQARITTLRQLTIGGAGFVTRQRPGNPAWDPTREAMVADPMQARVHLPKFFAQWDTDRWGVIAGTYRIGFGQRLVFDTSDRYTPNGFYLDDAIYRPTTLGVQCRESAGELPASPCSGAAGDLYGTADFRWRDSLRGVAIGAKHLDLPVGWMQLYAFGSWQSRQVYQYDVADVNTCEDARDSNLCPSPPVFVGDPGDPLAPTSTHKFQTLPNMYDELLGGANVSWFYDRRTHVGITGYGATAVWKLEGAELDFKGPATRPFGGAWGAIGADMSWGERWSDLAVEVARSFDSMATARTLSEGADYGGGGFAGIARHTTTLGRHELELSARYYDQDYANPFAGSIAEADEFNGNRHRDEAGGRVRYNARLIDRLDLRAFADFWVNPSDSTPKFRGFVRSDFDATPWLRPGLWLAYRNTDLRAGSFGGCINTAGLDETPRQEDGSISYRSGCLSEVGQITARLGFRPARGKAKGKLSLTAQYQHEVIDDVSVDGRPRQDAAAFLILRSNPVGSFRLNARLRYLNEDLADNARQEHSLWTYIEGSYVFSRVFQARLRYDTFVWLDERDNTLARVPSPEHRLRLQLEARF